MSGHASSGSSPFGTRTLRQGMRGSQVTLLQFYLDVAGYRTSADGYLSAIFNCRRDTAGACPIRAAPNSSA